MSTLAANLARYGEYHRDRRNVATHLLGIPMIVLAVEVLLSRPVWAVAGLPLTPAMLASVAAGLFYLSLDLRFGLVMAGLLALCAWIGLQLAALSTVLWLGWGMGLFVAGWIIQFVGHAYEGRKPAFLDDIKSLLIGPLFVVAEVAFLLGMRRELYGQITPTTPR
jgi:uncharacterized membrane protein YGL010W